MTFRALLALLAAAALLAGCGSSKSGSSSSGAASTPASRAGSSTAATQTGSSQQQQAGFEGALIEPGVDLASPASTGTGTVHGIKCGSSEELAYHIHVHLAVYVKGTPRALPGGIGIPGSVIQHTAQGPVAVGGRCIYWLHTHAPDGIIHVESPTRRIYTLGEFFDEWRQPLSESNVAGNQGRVSSFVNGKPWTKGVRSIKLIPHSVIQLSVGTPVVPFLAMSWNNLQL